MNRFTRILAATTIAAFPASTAFSFELGFDWGDLKLCTSGNPNKVTNPTFTLKNVPAGTKVIRFKLKDVDVPNYNHGGAAIGWGGQSKINPGIFDYKSPCPPNGSHTYRWTATALDGPKGKVLGEASAEKDYP